MSAPDELDELDRASTYLAGARNAENLDLRLLFAARCRLALDAAVAREKALRCSLDAVEKHLVELAKAAK